MKSTVKELIKKLEQMDPDAKVMVLRVSMAGMPEFEVLDTIYWSTIAYDHDKGVLKIGLDGTDF